MLKIGKYFLWLVVILVIAVGLDQTLVRMPMAVSGLQQGQAFYVDFRSRLLALVAGTVAVTPQPNAIDVVIERSALSSIDSAAKSKRYLYVDADGTLQFADSLELVPVKYIEVAQPLAE